MQQWEYLTVWAYKGAWHASDGGHGDERKPTVRYLATLMNARGAEGWELISVLGAESWSATSETTLVFKRPKP